MPSTVPVAGRKVAAPSESRPEVESQRRAPSMTPGFSYVQLWTGASCSVKERLSDDRLDVHVHKSAQTHLC